MGPPRSSEPLLLDFATLPQLSIGLISATQGRFIPDQFLLDVTQGTRVSTSTYAPFALPVVQLERRGAGGVLAGWPAVRARGASAPQTIEPGLLAGTIPGGAAYVTALWTPTDDAIAAADRSGAIAALSSGAPTSLLARTEALATRFRLVVVDLPPGAAGLRTLSGLLARRSPAQLVIAVQAPATPGASSLLPIGVAGLGPPRGLTSTTTNDPGLVAAIDLAPTILRHLGLRVPAAVRGQPIRTAGARDAQAMIALRDRLAVVDGRRLPILTALLFGWLLLLLLAGAIDRFDASGRAALRIGGLALMWTPSTVLAAAALEPLSQSSETLVVVGGAFLLAAGTDRLLPWPRGPFAPAAIGLLFVGADLAGGSELIVRSLLGPNPSAGARFYGVGNEFKSGLTVLVLAGVAAALDRAARSRRAAATFAFAGIGLGVLLGSGRLGAGVGAVVIVAAATTVATLTMLPGRWSAHRVALVIASPLIGLAALALVDVASSGGHGHYVHNVIEPHSIPNLAESVSRRAWLAWGAFRRGNMPWATLAAVLAVACAVRNRRIYDPVRAPAWHAALLGGLAGGIAGTLSEDSGPLLLVVAVTALAAVTVYIHGGVRPEGREPHKALPPLPSNRRDAATASARASSPLNAG